MNKSKLHTAHKYLLNPMHQITVSLIGVGGTGSKMLSNLAMMDQALRALGHLGLHVIAFDDDTITEANIGRQAFSPCDIGFPKAAILISRINRFYGLNWRYVLERVDEHPDGNILITCVDNKKTRKTISKSKQPQNSRHEREALYWLDMGNGKDYGQVVLSTLFQSKNNSLKSPMQLMPGIFNGKEDNKPSCSMAEALKSQDLFINTSMAMYASQLLWKLISEGQIDYQGCYVNMKTLQVNKIKIQ